MEATAEQVRDAVRRAGGWPVELDPRGPSWVPLTDAHLAVDGITERIRVRLGGVERRVAESTAVLGLAARVWSLTAGTAFLADLLPDVTGAVITDLDGAIRLGLREPRGLRDPSDSDVVAAALTVLTPVVERSRLSHRLLWGNVSSAAPAYLRPLLPEPMPTGRRTTCCLYYRVPGGGLCGDCVFTHPPRSRARTQDVRRP